MTWLPMDKAPKDGTRIVLKYNAGIGIFHYVPDSGRLGNWVNDNHFWLSDFLIIGWRPLTSIPASVFPPPEGHDLIVYTNYGGPFLAVWNAYETGWFSAAGASYIPGRPLMSDFEITHWFLVPEKEGE